MTVQNESNPDGDIEVKYIGLRPAEKLFEELLIGSNVQGTRHPRIMRADEDSLSSEELTNFLGDLSEAAEQLDYDRARNILMCAVKEYAPSNGIDDLVWVRKSGTDSSDQDQTVVDFPKRP